MNKKLTTTLSANEAQLELVALGELVCGSRNIALDPHSDSVSGRVPAKKGAHENVCPQCGKFFPREIGGSTCWQCRYPEAGAARSKGDIHAYHAALVERDRAEWLKSFGFSA